MLDLADAVPAIAPIPACRSAALTQVIVISPNELSGACMVAGLAELADVQTETCSDPARHIGNPPDIVLLQDPEDPADPRWLFGMLVDLAQRWPATLVMVVTGDLVRATPLCLKSGVSACLSSMATIEQLAAAILLIGGNIFVYEGEAATPNLPPSGGPPPVAQVADYLLGRGASGGNGATMD